MARLDKSRVVLSFRVGRGLVKARQRYENFARDIARKVAFSYAEDQYDEMRKTLQATIADDVRRELTHQALLYRRLIIGAAGTQVSPAGSLDTAVKGEGAPQMPLAAMLPSWAPRNAQYLQWKRRVTGGIGWFDNQNLNRYRGKTGTVSPEQGGYLFDNMRAATWEGMFGPVSVRFYRMRKLTENDAEFNFGKRGRKLQVQIGSIQVRALSQISPDMLPGFNTGHVRASSGGNAPLMRLIFAHDPELEVRLGRMNNGVYRPTLEPFLGFFLTQAIPHAVNARLRKGNFGTLFK